MLRALQRYEQLQVTAINDLTDTSTLALLKYDSLYGRLPREVELQEITWWWTAEITPCRSLGGNPWGELG